MQTAASGADGSLFIELLYTVSFTARSELQRVLFLAPSVCGFLLVVYEISRELLNEYAPNSHRRRVWSLARTNLEVKIKGQGQGH